MYTFAFLKRPIAPLELPTGIDGQVQLVETDYLAAIIEPDLAIAELQADDATLMRSVLSHDRVIRSLFLQTTILPLRFGTCFVSLQGLLAHMELQQQTYLDQLDRFEGKAEYTLKLVPLEIPETPIAADLKGKDYFLAKKQQYQAQQDYQRQQQAEMMALLQTLNQTYPQVLPGQSSDNFEKVFMLVDRQDEAQLLQQLEQWRTHCPMWQISIEEALPPYHFVMNAGGV